MAHPELLNMPEDGAKKLKKRIPPFLNRSRSAKQVLGMSQLMLGGLLLGASGGYPVYLDMVVIPKNNAAISRQLEQYPEMPQDLYEAALKEVQTFETRSKALGQQGEIDQIPHIFDPQHLKRSYELVDVYSKKQELESRIWKQFGKGAGIFFGITSIVGLGIVSLGGFELLLGERMRSKRDAADALLSLRPDWKETPPSEEELIKLCRGLSYLPPVGGKIPLVMNENEVDENLKKFDPSLTAEQQVNNVTKLRQKGELGDIYVHQLTVQGRLPDRFKHTAIALVLNSPHFNDWTKPFFQAPWGETAPLIHDGGKMEKNIGPIWYKVKGRTDFLQRIARVHAPELEQNEGLNIDETTKLPNLTELRKEQTESNRLILEAKAYQRLALALHAQTGTAPQKIPQEIQIQLAQEWVNFEASLDDLLKSYGINGVSEVQWFRDKPVEYSNWHGNRYEAEWAPIREQLIHAEEVKKSNPEIRASMTRLLLKVTDRIDRIIGILPAIAWPAPT